MHNRILKRSAAVSIASALLAVQVDAQEESVGDTADVVMSLAWGQSDNLFQEESGTDRGSYSALGLLVDFSRESQRLLLDIDGDIEYREYSESQLEDEPFGTLNAQIEIRPIPDRFSWIVSNLYGEGRADPLAPRGPANREQVNITSTGPALFLPLGQRTEMRLQSLVGKRNYEDTVGADSDTVDSRIGVHRQISSTAEASLAFSRRDVEYDAPEFDNEIERTYISYTKELASGQVSMAVGSNRVDFIDRAETLPYFDMDWTRDVSARSSLSLQFDNFLTDTSDSFRGGQDLDEVLQSVDVFERSSTGLEFSFRATRSQYSLGGRIGKDRYENAGQFDNDIAYLYFLAERLLTTEVTGGLEVAISERDYQSTALRDDELGMSIWVEKSFGRRLSFRADYEHRDSEYQIFAGYDENIIRFSMQYDLNPRE